MRWKNESALPTGKRGSSKVQASFISDQVPMRRSPRTIDVCRSFDLRNSGESATIPRQVCAPYSFVISGLFVGGFVVDYGSLCELRRNVIAFLLASCKVGGQGALFLLQNCV